jgi:hypothetical protein
MILALYVAWMRYRLPRCCIPWRYLQMLYCVGCKVGAIARWMVNSNVVLPLPSCWHYIHTHTPCPLCGFITVEEYYNKLSFACHESDISVLGWNEKTEIYAQTEILQLVF